MTEKMRTTERSSWARRRGKDAAVAVAAASGGDDMFGGVAGRELEERKRAPE